MNPDEKRMFKIEKFKREKAAKKRMQEINRFLMISKRDSSIDHEEEQRELYILTLQSYVRDALDELDMLGEELVMLEMRQKAEEAEQEKSERDKRNNTAPSSSSHAQNISPARKFFIPPMVSIILSFPVSPSIFFFSLFDFLHSGS
jgi:hypothetical protein